MRVVLDTNVFIPGIFFRDAPAKILEAWRDGTVLPVLSVDILVKYDRVGRDLALRYPGVDPGPLIELVATRGQLYHVPPLPERVCDDPDDDKFLACALASRCRLVITGDRALLRADRYGGARVIRPRKFVDDILRQT